MGIVMTCIRQAFWALGIYHGRLNESHMNFYTVSFIPHDFPCIHYRTSNEVPCWPIDHLWPFVLTTASVQMCEDQKQFPCRNATVSNHSVQIIKTEVKPTALTEAEPSPLRKVANILTSTQPFCRAAHTNTRRMYFIANGKGLLDLTP